MKEFTASGFRLTKQSSRSKTFLSNYSRPEKTKYGKQIKETIFIVKGSRINAIKSLTATISIAFVSLFSTQSLHSKQLNAHSFAFADGAAIYAERCVNCHGSDGRAQTPRGKRKGATDFTSAKWKPNDARMMKVIAEGKGNMPSFKEVLSEDEIKAVMMFVKTFKK